LWLSLAAGQTIGMRFAEEQRHFRPVPMPFAPEATTLANRVSVGLGKGTTKAAPNLAAKPCASRRSSDPRRPDARRDQ
jgi:hypothetical protein